MNIPQYQKSDLKIDSDIEPHQYPIPLVIRAVSEIISIEGPIHQKEVATRYAEAFGKTKVGNRILEHVELGLFKARVLGEIVNKDLFWGTKEQFQNTAVRDRGRQIPVMTNAEFISPTEFIACKALIVNEFGEMELDELIRTIAKAFGFKRAGPDFQKVAKLALTE